jgi:hypothetical protein
MKFKIKPLALGIACAGLLTIHGCGGGGGVADNDLTLSGVAATGLAIDGGTVEVKCATGAGSGTTLSDGTGKYTVTVLGGVLPCLLEVTSKDKVTVLHSLAEGTGKSATANITPFTELLVANLSGEDPSTYFKAFASATAGNATKEKIVLAQKSIRELLAEIGVDLGDSGDLITGELTPKIGADIGNKYDQALEGLKAKYTKETTLASLTQAVSDQAKLAAGSTGSKEGPSLPIFLSTKPSAATCSALRSTTYHQFRPTAAASERTSTFTFDAVKLVSTYSVDNSKQTWVPHATDACRFTANNGKVDLFVSQAGVIAGRYTPDDGTTYAVALAFPVQTHSLAALEGTWNTAGMKFVSANKYTGITGDFKINATGVVSESNLCPGDTGTAWKFDVCAIDATPPKYSVNATDKTYFAKTDAGLSSPSGKLFVYVAGNGAKMMVQMDDNGSLLALTQQRTSDLPTVEDISKNWNIQVRESLFAKTINSSDLPTSANSSRVVSVDSTKNTWIRNTETIGSNPSDAQDQTFKLNTPRNGYSFRAEDSATSIRAITNFNLHGMGVSMTLIPSVNRFQVSVGQPVVPVATTPPQ